MTKKPHKGKLYNWSKNYFNKDEQRQIYNEEPGLGYVIHGYTTKHPHLDTTWRTSWVVKQDKNGNIETRNSRYKLVGKEITR